MTPHIRPYQASDLDQLLICWENATRIAHTFFTEPFIEKEKENTAQLYLPNADTWVVVDNRKVMGFVALLGNEVGGLFVDPAYHHKGFGKALMDKALAILWREITTGWYHSPPKQTLDNTKPKGIFFTEK